MKCDAVQASIVGLSIGDDHCCACDELGSVYTWGRTREGQCGSVDVQPVQTPHLMTGFKHVHVGTVACGADASFALTAGGSVYQWGAVHRPSTAMAHSHLVGYGRGIEHLSDDTRFMLMESLSSFLSGADADGNAADEDARGAEGEQADDTSIVGTKRELRSSPERMVLPAGERASAVAAGFGFGVIALSSDGLLTFGLNDRFQCGLHDRIPRDVPTRVPALNRVRITGVACGQQHSLAVDDGGTCWSWGNGSFGQLGHGRRKDERQPRRIEALVAVGTVVAVACGQQHSAVLTRSHDEPSACTRLVGFGHAEYGQLGTGDLGGSGSTARDYPLPRWIDLPSTCAEPQQVSCGALYTAVLTVRGELLTFGWGSTGALGLGTFGYELEPRVVESLQARHLAGLAAGARNVAAFERGSSGGTALARDLDALLVSGVGADCEIIAGRGAGARSFRVHMVIIACRCPRMHAMLAFTSSRFNTGAPAASEAPRAWLCPGRR